MEILQNKKFPALSSVLSGSRTGQQLAGDREGSLS